MGLHTDEAVLRNGQYANRPLNRCARLMAAAHGGQVLLSGATAALVRSELPDGASLIDLGEHRLHDLADRMRIFQLAHPDLPREFPALRLLEAVAGSLAVPVSSFIGRARELQQIAAALGQARVVTLTGPAESARQGWACRWPPGCWTGRRMGCGWPSWPWSPTKTQWRRPSPARYGSRRSRAGPRWTPWPMRWDRRTC